MRKKLITILLVLCFIQLFTISLLAADVLTLKEALKLGLDNNSGLKESIIDRRKAELDLELASRGLYPELSLSSSYTRLEEGPMIPVGFDSQIMQPVYEKGSPNNYNTSISLQQPLYLGGKIRLGIEQARKGVELADIQTEREKNDLLLKIIQSYFNVLMAEKRVAIEEEALELVREHKRVAQVSLEAGITLKTDLLQVEIEEGKALHSLKNARNQLLLARKSLGNLIGKDLTNAELLVPEYTPEIELNREKLYLLALEWRPELKLLKINKEILETNLKMEESRKFPDIVLVGNYTWQGDEPSFDDGNWSITLSGSVSLYDGGKSGPRQEKIKKDLDKLRESEASLTEMIELEIEGNILSVQENLENISLQELNLKRAEENLHLENKRYQAGLGTNLDVMNAQTILKQTRISKMQAEYQYKLSLFSLLHKTGELVAYCKEVIDSEE